MPEEMIVVGQSAVLVREGSAEVSGETVCLVDRPEPRSLTDWLAALERKIEREDK